MARAINSTISKFRWLRWRVPAIEGWFVFVVAVFVSLPHASQSALASEELRQRFLTEYPAASRELQDRLQNVEITMEFKHDRSVNGPAKRTIFARNGEFGDIVEPLTDKPRGKIFNRVHLLTGNRAYILYQRAKGGKYSIEATGANADNDIKNFRRSYFDPYLYASVTYGPPLTELLSDPSNIVDAKWVEDDESKKLLEVEFTADPEKYNYLKRGKFVFDLAHEWVLAAIVDCEIVRGPDSPTTVLRGSRSFEQLKNGAWVPVSLSLEEHWTEAGAKQENVESEGGVLVSSSVEVDPKRFSLLEYGLGDVVDLKNSAQSRMILIIAANVLLVLGIYLTFRHFRPAEKK